MIKIHYFGQSDFYHQTKIKRWGWPGHRREKMLISALVKPNFAPAPGCSLTSECFTINLQIRKSRLAVMKTAFTEAQRWGLSMSLEGRSCLGAGIAFLEYCFQPREATQNCCCCTHRYKPRATCKESPLSLNTASESSPPLAPAQNEVVEWFSCRSAELPGLLSAVPWRDPTMSFALRHPRHHAF